MTGWASKSPVHPNSMWMWNMLLDRSSEGLQGRGIGSFLKLRQDPEYFTTTLYSKLLSRRPLGSEDGSSQSKPGASSSPGCNSTRLSLVPVLCVPGCLA